MLISGGFHPLSSRSQSAVIIDRQPGFVFAGFWGGYMARRRVWLNVGLGLVLSVTTGLSVLSPTGAEPARAASKFSVGAPLTPVKPGTPPVPKAPKHTPLVSTPVPAPPVWPSAATAVVQVSGAPAKAGNSALSVAAAAPGTPVALAKAADNSAPAVESSSPSQVKVEAFDQATVAKLHGVGVAFRLTRADAATAQQKSGQAAAAAKPAPVSVKVDYSGFRNAYGGDFATRLQLFAYPSCYLTTPSLSTCSVRTPVKAVNDTAAGALTATVAADGDPAAVAAQIPSTKTTSASGSIYVLASTASSPSGNYAASPLNAGERWTTDLNSGAFTYSYPFKAPAVPGAVTPTLSVNYNSQSVDGHTAANNPQASQSGIGWSVGQNYVQRDYESCAIQGVQAHNGWSLDECWDNDNLTLSLNGVTSELIRDTTTSGWRLKNDNGWTVERLTGADNGDNNPQAPGEYIRITTNDGTKYTFGQNEVWNGRSPESAWLVPVFSIPGNSPPNSPSCNAGGTGPDFEYCMMPWRWMLDKVEDPHHSIARYFYGTERNNYKMRNGSGTGTYTRGGFLQEIDYGIPGVATSAAARVLLYYGSRCNISGRPVHFERPDPCPAISTDNASIWPDVPYDLQCDNTSCPNVGPSFWSQYALVNVETDVFDPRSNAMPAVDSWDLSYMFPAITGGPAILWLASIQHHGVDNGAADEAPIYTYSAEYNNRLMTTNPPNGGTLNMLRLTAISNELGAETDVQYGTPNACDPALLPTQDSSNGDCFEEPNPPSASDPNPSGYQWYVKYQVTATCTFDLVADSSTGNQFIENTQYLYGKNAGAIGGQGLGAAWHMAQPLVSTSPYYNDYRGYAVVEVVKGEPNNGGFFTIGTMESVDQYLFYRGQYDDYKKSTSTYRDETVTPFPDLKGTTQAPQPDYEFFAGKMLQHIQHDPNDGNALTWDMKQYLVQQTATGYLLPNDRSHNAFRITNDNDTSQAFKADGSIREIKTDSAIDAFGNTTALMHYGETGVNLNEYCTATAYSQAADHTWEAPYDVKTLAGTCQGGLSAETFLYYDNQATWGASPQQGDVTKTVTAPGMNQTVTTTATYDIYGRIATSTDADGNQSTTTYSPATGIPTSVTTADAQGHSTTTTYDIARGLPVSVTDANYNVTNETYDALGRLTSVSLPGDAAGSPSYKFSYSIPYTNPTGGSGSGSANTNVPASAKTEKLQADGSYAASYTFMDGLGRSIETQTPTTGGFSVATTGYDSLGRKVLTEGPNFLATGLGTFQFWGPANNNDGVSTQTWYDTLSRPTKSTNFYNRQTVVRNGAAQTTTTDYWADQSKTVPPAPSGAWSVTKYDAFGHKVEVDEPGPVGSQVVTKYGYDVLGDLNSITDNAGHQTTYNYDWLKRRTSTHDPDTGQSTTRYDGAGNVIQSRDANFNFLNSAYDSANRKTISEISDAAIGVWYLNESTTNASSPSMAADASGNGRNATASGSITHVVAGPKPGLFATGFDGIGTSITTSGPILDTSKSFSVSAWANLTAGGAWQEVLSQDGTQASGFFLQYDKDDNAWAFSRCPTDTVNCTAARAHASTPPATGTWTQLTASFDASTGAMKLYVNGQLAGSATDTTPVGSSGPLAIGRGLFNGTKTDYFKGQISDVRVYDIPLNATQASNLYQRGSTTGAIDPAAAYTYDNQAGGFGKPSTATSYSDGGAYTVAGNGYDAQGRSLGTSWNIPSSEGALAGTYTETIGYDKAGHQNTITYPAAGGLAAETVTTNYDNLGQPTTTNGGLGTLVTNTTFDGLGRITGRTLGNTGLGQTVRGYGYEQDTEALSTIAARTTNNSGTVQIQADTYNRDAAGDVTSITSPTQNQCFTYDGQAQMTRAFTTDSATCAGPNPTYGPSPYDVTYGIDGLGNILQTTDNIASTTHIWQYNDANHVHALTNNGGDTYGYDANGDMTSRSVDGLSSTLAWNEQQQLKSVVQGPYTTGFVYSADGGRLIRHDTGTNQATLFLGPEELVLNGSTITAHRTYASGSASVAERTPTTLTWLLSDAQGSAQITVNSATGAVTRQFYTPYGAQRGGNLLQSITDKGFLGHVEDYNTGLVQDGARYYDPSIGHFISPDPINTGAPSGLNAYNYAGDNPETASDPSGLMAVDGGEGGCGYETGGAAKHCLDMVQKMYQDAREMELHQQEETLVNSGDTKLLKSVLKFAWHASSASDVYDCAAHASVSGCSSAAASVALTVFTGGESAVAKGAAEAVGKDVVKTGTKDAVKTSEKDGADALADAASCALPHSFTAATPVLMADGTSKPIEQVKVGDTVTNADPATGATQRHNVDAVIVTKTDHDFADVTITTPNGDQTVHTTYHHPFYSVDNASFIEAVKLKPGDRLETPDGAVKVSAVRLFHDSQTTYDLTIDGLHTYYVLAGDTPVLVHNTQCRTADGKFAKSDGTPGRVGAIDERTTLDQLELDGAPVVRGSVTVRVPGVGERIYDGAVQIDGKWYGVETKGGTSPLTPRQQAADAWLNTPGNTATSVGGNSGYNLEGVFYSWVPDAAG
ncbi:LamG-like jellyroll fold domain-containing protein [Catenulispora subtropica]|uniref:YD repeat protein n=1 Tax=Catenulispora subtropica TaxID=450798 RepID=A0ABN2S9J4_9ACTN